MATASINSASGTKAPSASVPACKASNAHKRQTIRSLSTIAADHDGIPLLFTVGNGTLDLRTGTDSTGHRTSIVFEWKTSIPSALA
jgi:hypothetical protein